MRSRLLSYAVVVTLIATLGLTGCKNLPWKKKRQRQRRSNRRLWGKARAFPAGSGRS